MERQRKREVLVIQQSNRNETEIKISPALSAACRRFFRPLKRIILIALLVAVTGCNSSPAKRLLCHAIDELVKDRVDTNVNIIEKGLERIR